MLLRHACFLSLVSLFGCATLRGSLATEASIPRSSSSPAAPPSSVAGPDSATEAAAAPPVDRTAESAESRAIREEGAARYKAEKTKSCTFEGKVNEPCLQYHLTRDTLEISRDVAMHIRECFEDVRAVTEKLENRRSVGEHAQALARRKGKGEPDALNPFVDECLRLSYEHFPPDWKVAIQRDLLVAECRRKVNKEFEPICGVRADMYESDDVPQVVLWGKSATKKQVVFEGKNESGLEITVRCDGVITGRQENGKPIKLPPTTIGERRKDEKRACFERCRETSSVCSDSYRRGTTSPLCKSACDEKCR